MLEYTLVKFTGDAKEGTTVGMLEGRATIRDLKKLQEWASRNLTKFSKDRCQVLCLGRKSHLQQ